MDCFPLAVLPLPVSITETKSNCSKFFTEERQDFAFTGAYQGRPEPCDWQLRHYPRKSLRITGQRSLRSSLITVHTRASSPSTTESLQRPHGPLLQASHCIQRIQLGTKGTSHGHNQRLPSSTPSARSLQNGIFFNQNELHKTVSWVLI